MKRILFCIFTFFHVFLCGYDERFYLNLLPETNEHYRIFAESLRLLSNRYQGMVVEAGTSKTNENVVDALSTVLFGCWAYDQDGLLFSLQENSAQVDFAKFLSKPYLRAIVFSIEDTVSFLKAFPGQIDLLFLNSTQYDAIDPYLAQVQKLKELEAAYDKLKEKAIVLIDNRANKGKLAIDRLLELGWHFHIKENLVLLLKFET